MVYAVVRAGGRQEKVEVGTIVVLDRIAADKNGNVELVPVLLVDGDKITHGAKDLAKVKVVAEVLNDLRGPKIVIQKFKNIPDTRSARAIARSRLVSRSPASVFRKR